MVLFSTTRQSLLIPSPPLTEKNIGDLSGKVVLVTGGNSGIGYSLCSILYGANATVFLAGRDAEACNAAAEKIRGAFPTSTGRLEALTLDMSDFKTVHAAVRDFLARADRIDYLCNNAGVMAPEAGSRGAQGHELQQATNCLGPLLLTELLRPLLIRTAERERREGRENVVRVSWAGSAVIGVTSPKGGVQMVKGKDGVDNVKTGLGPLTDYGTSKTANLFLAKRWGDLVKEDGIVSVCFNPGNLRTNLQRHWYSRMPALAAKLLDAGFHDQRYGAYTELWCGFSPDLTTADNGILIAPWGRRWSAPSDIEQNKDGELSSRYFQWAQKQIEPYAVP